MATFLGLSDTRWVSWNLPRVLALAASLHLPQIHLHQTSTHLISPTRPPEELRRVRRRRARAVLLPRARRVRGLVIWRGDQFPRSSKFPAGPLSPLALTSCPSVLDLNGRGVLVADAPPGGAWG